MKEKILVLSSFWLKLIALLTMTLDHIAVAMKFYFPSMANLDVIYPTFRILGRIAMPLFIFMIVEGMIHTKSPKKYFFRLGLMAILVLIAELCMEYIPQLGTEGFCQNQGNIFIDLLLCAFAVWACNKKDHRYKFFLIIPLAIGIMSYIAYAFEYANGYTIYWMPFFLRTQYNILSLLIALGFYFSRKLVTSIYEATYHTPGDAFENTKEWRFYVNLLSILFLGIITLLWHVSTYFLDKSYQFWLVDYQNFMMLGCVFILLYNGKRGYNKKWFQWSTYFYYPIHILIIALVFFLLTM